LKNLLSKTAKNYTEKDKIVFKKLDDIKKSGVTVEGKLGEISKSKDHLLNCFERIDEEILKVSSTFFNKFKKEFE
jgi:hypothetical protein